MLDTQAFLYAVAIYVIGLGMLFWNYGTFTATIVKWSRPPIKSAKNKKITQPPLSISEKLKCYIPGYQAVLVRKSLYKKSGIFGPLMIIAVAGIVLNLINKFLLGISPMVMLVMSIIMYICTVLFIALYGIITADCAKMYGFSVLTIILCFLIPYLWCWYLHNNVPNIMRKMYKEDTFHEHTGDTVVKQRNN